MLERIVRFSRKLTIEVAFKESFLKASTFIFSDDKNAPYIVESNAHGIQIQRDKDSIFKGRVFHKFYFYNYIAREEETTQAIPYVFSFTGLGTIKIRKGYKSNGFIVFEVLLNDDVCSLVEYQPQTLFGGSGLCKISVEDVKQINIDIGVFVFAFIYNFKANQAS